MQSVNPLNLPQRRAPRSAPRGVVSHLRPFRGERAAPAHRTLYHIPAVPAELRFVSTKAGLVFRPAGEHLEALVGCLGRAGEGRGNPASNALAAVTRWEGRGGAGRRLWPGGGDARVRWLQGGAAPPLSGD